MLILLVTIALAADPNMEQAPELNRRHQNFIDIQKLNFAIQKKYGSVPLRRPMAAKEMYRMYILQQQWGVNETK